VASQWEVDSNATAELMKRFHFYRRKEKMSTASALRRAQLEMLEAEDKRFNNPYYWAAFAAFGGYTTF
jgi:CHAT domain-containing protein